MKNRITQAKEETKNINNYLIEIERQTKEIQDEIKKINVKISAAIKDKDKIVNEITAMKKKNSILRNKIYKAENSANEFLFYVGQLAKSTEKIKIK
jgi:predicted nuclease with TOPRIM domain